jgi:hypothetical protein
MPDACQDACSGLTCADYAHETCELARLVGCLCAGCDSRDFSYDARDELGPKLVLELHPKPGLFLCFAGALVATVASQLVLARHFPHAFAAPERAALAWEKTVVFDLRLGAEEKEPYPEDEDDAFEVHDLIYDEWQPPDLVDGVPGFDDDELRDAVADLRARVDDDDERDVARGLVVRVDDLVEADDEEEEEDAGDRSPSRDPRDYDV